MKYHKHTEHSAIQQRRRGISQDVLDLVEEHGEEIPVVGGAVKKVVSESKIQAEQAKLRQRLKVLEQVRGIAMVIAGNSLVTVMHQTKRLRYNK